MYLEIIKGYYVGLKNMIFLNAGSDASLPVY